MGDRGRLKTESAMQTHSIANSKRVVSGLDILVLDVMGQNFIRHIPARCHKVAPRPQMSAPKLLLQRPKVPQQMVRTLALDGLHHATRRQLRRHTQQQMHMVPTHVPPQDFDVVRAADLPHQLAQLHRHVSAQHRLAVLGDEDEMVVQQINSVRRLPVGAHAGIVPQAS